MQSLVSVWQRTVKCAAASATGRWRAGALAAMGGGAAAVVPAVSAMGDEEDEEVAGSPYADEHYVDTTKQEEARRADTQGTLKLALGAIAVCAAAAYSVNRGKGALPNQIMSSRIYMQSGALICISSLAAFDVYRRSNKMESSA
mmetsp:Transcript_14281/g.38289  ORF Transcript_14281/g.38289 Transcript_14281/m.38289 type:complete len:144 (+) Transcript_14281:166-597(+)